MTRTRIVSLVGLLTTACGGSPFALSGVVPPPDGGVNSEINIIIHGDPEAGATSAPEDAGGEDARPDRIHEFDAHVFPEPEASPETGMPPSPEAASPEAGSPCVPIPPWTLMNPFCPTFCTGGCAGQNAPEYYFAASPMGCSGVATPPECQACGEYSCACLVEHSKVPAGCSCNGSTGMPTVICP